MRDAARQLGRLRELRPTRQTSTPVGGEKGVLAGLVAGLRKEDSVFGRVERALRSELPPELAAACKVVEVERNRVTLRVPDTAARYRLDRWLRSGGKTCLKKTTQRELDVRVVISP